MTAKLLGTTRTRAIDMLLELDVPLRQAQSHAQRFAPWGAIEDFMEAWDFETTLREIGRSVRLKRMLALVGFASVVRWQSADEYWTLILHPAVKVGYVGQWQLSRLDKHGPYGHTNFETFEEGVGAAIGAHPKGSCRDEGSATFALLDTAGSRS